MKFAVPVCPHCSDPLPGSTGVPCPIAGTRSTSTTTLPSAARYCSLRVWFGPIVDVRSGLWSTPCTAVHWSRSSSAFLGTTFGSLSPCQIATRGQGPEYPG